MSLMVWGSVQYYRVVAIFGGVWWYIVLCTCCWGVFFSSVQVGGGIGAYWCGKTRHGGGTVQGAPLWAVVCCICDSKYVDVTSTH